MNSESMAHGSNTFRQCRGDGQGHIQSLTNRKGEPNTDPRAGQPYDTICFDQIRDLASAPPVEPKHRRPWMLASTYNQPDARTFEVQAQRGAFTVLAVDVDKGNVPFERLHQVLTELLKGHRLLIHSTGSAKADDRRWRALMPLQMAIPYEAFECYQLALFRALEHNGIAVDRTLARAAQLIFLPVIYHAGAYYEWAEVTGEPFFCDRAHWLNDHAAALYKLKLEEAQRARTSKESGPHSVIGWVNRTWLTESLLEQYDYSFDGKEWSSPYQQKGSGNHSTMVRDDGSWFSLSHSDMAAGLGRLTSNGCNGDAFDLICHYSFGNDRDRALAWARAERRRVEAATPAMQAAEALVRGMGL